MEIISLAGLKGRHFCTTVPNMRLSFLKTEDRVHWEKFEWLDGWMNDPDLPSGCKTVLAALLSLMPEQPVVQATVHDIASRANLCVKTTKSHLATAERHGWILRAIVPGQDELYVARRARTSRQQTRFELA
jgi:hypothetical protein